MPADRIIKFYARNLLIILLLFSTACSNDKFLGLSANEILGLAAIGGLGYVIYKECKKEEGYSNPSYVSSPPSVPFCPRGNYQGCCSYHGGILGCLNYRVVCADKTYSPSCACNSDYCAFN